MLDSSKFNNDLKLIESFHIYNILKLILKATKRLLHYASSTVIIRISLEYLLIFFIDNGFIEAL